MAKYRKSPAATEMTRPLDLEISCIPLDATYVAASPFCLRAGRGGGTDSEGLGAAADLKASLARVGMLCPPLVWRANAADEKPYVAVTGFARIEAWRALGHAEVVARVAPGEATFEQLLAMAIEEHRWSARGLNVMEQALALEKLAAVWPSERVASEGMALLGLKPSARRAERLLALRALPDAVQDLLARGDLAEALVEHLEPFADACAMERVARAIAALRMSLGEARDFARQAFEVCRRDGVAPEALLEELGLGAAPAEGTAGNVPAVRARVLRTLRVRRMPVLVALERRHAEGVRRLGLPDGARIVPPRDFEGDGFRLEARVANVEDLERLARVLESAVRERGQVVREILNPSVEP